MFGSAATVKVFLALLSWYTAERFSPAPQDRCMMAAGCGPSGSLRHTQASHGTHTCYGTAVDRRRRTIRTVGVFHLTLCVKSFSQSKWQHGCSVYQPRRVDENALRATLKQEQVFGLLGLNFYLTSRTTVSPSGTRTQWHVKREGRVKNKDRAALNNFRSYFVSLF